MTDYKPVMVDGVPRCYNMCPLLRCDRTCSELCRTVPYNSLCEPAILARLAAAEKVCEAASDIVKWFDNRTRKNMLVALDAWRQAKGE